MIVDERISFFPYTITCTREGRVRMQFDNRAVGQTIRAQAAR